LLLIAHGSRRAEANADLDFIADGVRARGGFDFVKTAYLELAEPSIAEAGAACVEAGATEVVMMPYFLSPGMHVSEDLEHARTEFSIRFPKVAFRLAEPLGRHPLLIDIVCERAAGVCEPQDKAENSSPG
jgi:sirohydrochlorin ferrochelatase